jgi:hypothetical protein
MPAAGALIAMATERGRTATRDGQQYLLMLPVDPSAAAFDEALSGVANDVGHLQRRPPQALRIGAPGVVRESMSSGLAVALRCFVERCK